jgi:hypothetical protein
VESVLETSGNKRQKNKQPNTTQNLEQATKHHNINNNYIRIVSSDLVMLHVAEPSNPHRARHNR